VDNSESPEPASITSNSNKSACGKGKSPVAAAICAGLGALPEIIDITAGFVETSSNCMIY
jgi:hypothetical protein